MSIVPLKPALVILSLGSALMAWQWRSAGDSARADIWRPFHAVMDLPVPEQEDPNAEAELKRIAQLGVRKQFIAGGAQLLESFYEALARVEVARESGGSSAVVRILHYGDSPVTADLISADIRRLLQARFGDAGHGFCLIAKPWAWYGHEGVSMSASGWKIFSAMDYSSRFRYYGIGGVAFGGSPGSHAEFRFRAAGHTEMEVSYLEQPDGGTVEVSAGDVPLGSIDTVAEAIGSGFSSYALPPGTRHVKVVVKSGTPRLFGVSFRKPGAGLIYDSLGLNGASTAVPGRLFLEQHWSEQLRHYRPNLVIVNYGLNESGFPAYVEKYYAADLRQVIQRIRRALPGVSILLMSPTDRGRQISTDEIGTEPALPRLVAIQARVAGEESVAFFDTFRAMGGEGTMGRWYARRPRLVSADLLHPLPAGARIVGELAERALMEGFHNYKLDKMKQEIVMQAAKTATNPAGRTRR